MKNKKTGFMVLLLICGIIIGAIAAVIGMTLIQKRSGEKAPVETKTETAAETVPGSGGETFDDTTPDDPVPTDETKIPVISVNGQSVTMQEVNVYLYQLRDFYTAQYGESPWNTEMEDGSKLHEFAKNELYNGLIRTEILNSKAGDYSVELSAEEKQQCADEAKAYMEEIGPAIAQDFALNEEGVRLMKEKQVLSTKVYNAALEQIGQSAADTSDEGLAREFETLYETWKSEAQITTDAIWENIVIGSVG